MVYKQLCACVKMTDGTIQASHQSHLMAQQRLVMSVSVLASNGATAGDSGGEKMELKHLPA